MIPITISELVVKATQMRRDGYRLVQISCILADAFEITYSFDKDLDLVNLRVSVPKTEPIIPSITEPYLCAFTYENELQDLFGLTVTDMKINFNGNFYQTAVKTPFNPGATKTPEKANK